MPTADTTTPASVHRLHDMVTEEVSLVDRAANKRKFLVVKNEKGSHMPHGAEVVARADGSLTAAAAGTPATTAKASAKLTKGAQDALAAVLADCIASLGDAQKSVEGAEVVETEEEMDAGDIGDTMTTCAEDIEDALYSLFGLDEEPAPGGEAAGTPPAGETVTAAAPAPALDFGKRLEVRQAKRVLAKAAGTKVIATVIQKYGRKLKKDRVTRLQTVMNMLSSIIAEVEPAEVDKAKPPTPPAPAAGAEVGPDGKPKKKPGAPPVAAAKNEELEKVVKRVEGLEVELKKSHEQLATMRKNVTQSNTASVEGSGEKPVLDDFNWPMDMNDRHIEKRGGKNHFGD